MQEVLTPTGESGVASLAPGVDHRNEHCLLPEILAEAKGHGAPEHLDHAKLTTVGNPGMQMALHRADM